MKILNALTISALLGITAFAMSGCSSAQKGAAGAGLAGGIAGAVVGNNWVPIGPTTGAVVGGSSGAAIGGLVGDAYDQVTEADMNRELENLRAQLATKEDELAALRAGAPNSDQLAAVDQLNSRIGELETQLSNAQASAAAKADLEAQLASLRDTLSGTQAERDQLGSQIEALNGEKNALMARIGEKEGALSALQASLQGKEQAVDKLRQELESMNIKLEETSRGLTMTIVDSLLYSPGQSEFSDGGKDLVARVAGILKEQFPNRELLVEGHTDNQPIVHSGWRSNWELGAARSLTMLHELVDVHGMDPALVSAASYGEFRPASTNATPEGRKSNRRAVIVILPEKLPIQRATLAKAD